MIAKFAATLAAWLGNWADISDFRPILAFI